MGRNEIALDIFKRWACPDEDYAPLASSAYAAADAFLAAAAPAPKAEAPVPYVPKVGDVVRVTRPPTGEEWPCLLDDEWLDDHRPEGRVVETTTAHAAAGKVSIVRVGADHPPHGVEACRLALVRPAAPASPPAVDREGLARALRDAAYEGTCCPWHETPVGAREEWLRAADAAIAFIAKGGAS